METKLAYKGFDGNIACRGEKFEIGVVYSKEAPKEKPRLCSGDGWHYCNKLKDVFSHYPLNSKNRFFEIEVLGNFTDDGYKAITTSFKIIREVTDEAKQKLLHQNLNIDIAKEICQRNPLIAIGGSLALFLHGIKLKRFYTSKIGDIDAIMPFYQPLMAGEDADDAYALDEVNVKSAGNDYDACYIYGDDVKIDVKINPKQRYETIDFDGFKFKVAPLELIMEAKWRYAINGQQKHKSDCYEMLGKKTNP